MRERAMEDRNRSEPVRAGRLGRGVIRALPPLVRRARVFAARTHQGKEHGADPYVVHLDHVTEVLLRFGFGEDEGLLAAAYLHDVVEDVQTPLDVLRAVFPEDVVVLVVAVSDPPRLYPDEPRRERKPRGYPLIRQHPRAVLLKLADRIANVEASLRTESTHLRMYAREHPGFEAALRRKGEWEALWTHLEALFEEGKLAGRLR